MLRAMVVQVRVCENHQNGKDTHVRGLQIFARDEKERSGRGAAEVEGEGKEKRNGAVGRDGDVRVRLEEPEWMKEPELR